MNFISISRIVSNRFRVLLAFWYNLGEKQLDWFSYKLFQKAQRTKSATLTLSVTAMVQLILNLFQRVVSLNRSPTVTTSCFTFSAFLRPQWQTLRALDILFDSEKLWAQSDRCYNSYNIENWMVTFDHKDVLESVKSILFLELYSVWLRCLKGKARPFGSQLYRASSKSRRKSINN